MSRSNTSDYLQLFLENVPMIDTRSPVEYAKGAFENAVNLPLMNDKERHLVGTRYKEAGQDSAIQLGRELVTPVLQQERVECWLEFARQHPQGFLYCFRGGLRSRITQQWIAEGGIDYPYVEGGYKAMRRFLIESLEECIEKAQFILISGRTGTGKTLLLNRIKRSVDLEGLANHRGSSFGKMATLQPTPINFENLLSVALLKLLNQGVDAPIWLEGEGKQVGSLGLPGSLWRKMLQSPTLVLEAEMDRRVDIGIQDYVKELLATIQQTTPGELGFQLFAERHQHSLDKIRKRLGQERYKTASGLLQEALKLHREDGSTEAYRPFIELLLRDYYDPMYDYQLQSRDSEVIARGSEAVLLEYMRNRDVELWS